MKYIIIGESARNKARIKEIRTTSWGMRTECNDGGGQLSQFLSAPPLGGRAVGQGMADAEVFRGPRQARSYRTPGFHLEAESGKDS